ncbi:MAG: hypothetical protein JF623_05520 [Acidobacteria bacterium]|nr:hypothetical protein [Acidobacteriota bacterium]
MKPFAAAVILLLAQPAVAHAGVSLVARDVPLHGDRALMSTGTPRFDLVGVHWRGTGNVSFRTRSFAGRWSAWHAAAPEAEDGPDRPAQPGWRIGNPYWTGASAAIQYRTHGRVTRLRAFLVWSPVDALPPRRLSIAGSPALITRAGWGADESIRRAPPQFAASVNNAIVHHTAGTNSYSKSQSAAIVRGIEVYHVKGNGWNDIGYNALVDIYGQVFEGRYGGMAATRALLRERRCSCAPSPATATRDSRRVRATRSTRALRRSPRALRRRGCRSCTRRPCAGTSARRSSSAPACRRAGRGRSP